jgi:hypothetical protein
MNFRRTICATLVALSMTGAPAAARWVNGHQTDPYKCGGWQVWYYDWHPGDNGTGGTGYWDDDVRVCQRARDFVRHWQHWRRSHN